MQGGISEPYGLACEGTAAVANILGRRIGCTMSQIVRREHYCTVQCICHTLGYIVQFLLYLVGYT